MTSEFTDKKYLMNINYIVKIKITNGRKYSEIKSSIQILSKVFCYDHEIQLNMDVLEKEIQRAHLNYDVIIMNIIENEKYSSLLTLSRDPNCEFANNIFFFFLFVLLKLIILI